MTSEGLITRFQVKIVLILTVAISRVSSFALSMNSEGPKAFRGVLFDVDGTLADSWKLGYDATVVVLEKNGIPTITEETYHEGTRYTTPDRLARHAGLLPSDGEKYRKLGERLGKEFDDLYVDLVSTKTAGFYEGIHDMVDAIPENVKLGALTNACAGYAHAVLRANCREEAGGPAMKSRFVSVRGADNVPAPKPHGDGLLLCCEEIGVEPSECVYIGDSPSDGKAAEAAGMSFIGVSWGSHSMENLQKITSLRVCSTVDELKDLLSQKIAMGR